MTSMDYFRHPAAIVEAGSSIGPGTRIWAFAHVLPGARIGADCNICDNVFVEQDVVIGDRVTVKCGVQLWDGLRVADDVFIGPNATFTNDPSPRSKCYLASIPVTRIARGASIGANATILPGLTVGMRAMIGAGAVVTRNVPPYAIVTGNPARIRGYVTSDGQRPERPMPQRESERVSISVKGVKMLKFPEVEDLRGRLTYGEIDRHLPFTPKRYFVISDVPSKDVRGEHAHREVQQVLVCIKGNVTVMIDDGEARSEVVLDSASQGLYIPAMVWATQYEYSSDAVLLVLASEKYDASDYIRDYEEFLTIIKVGV